MLKKILWGLGVLVILFSSYIAYVMLTTRNHSPAETVQLIKGQTEVLVDYCRPFKKNRVIFGELVPYDTYWRTGANEPTIIRFSQSVTFGDKLIEAGSYRLYAIPGESEWTVALNTEIEEWGYYEPDYSLDVAQVKVPVNTLGKVQEQFLIELIENESGMDLFFKWDVTSVSVPIKI